MTDVDLTATAPRTYAMIDRQRTVSGSVFFTILTKTTDDIRRYPSRGHGRYASRAEAVAAAESAGAIVIKRWCDVTLTAAEAKAQYGS